MYQDTAVNGLPNYDFNDPPAVSLQGRDADGTTRGTPHSRSNRTQDNASPTISGPANCGVMLTGFTGTDLNGNM